MTSSTSSSEEEGAFKATFLVPFVQAQLLSSDPKSCPLTFFDPNHSRSGKTSKHPKYASMSMKENHPNLRELQTQEPQKQWSRRTRIPFLRRSLSFLREEKNWMEGNHNKKKKKKKQKNSSGSSSNKNNNINMDDTRKQKNATSSSSKIVFHYLYSIRGPTSSAQFVIKDLMMERSHARCPLCRFHANTDRSLLFHCRSIHDQFLSFEDQRDPKSGHLHILIKRKLSHEEDIAFSNPRQEYIHLSSKYISILTQITTGNSTTQVVSKNHRNLGSKQKKTTALLTVAASSSTAATTTNRTMNPNKNLKRKASEEIPSNPEMKSNHPPKRTLERLHSSIATSTSHRSSSMGSFDTTQRENPRSRKDTTMNPTHTNTKNNTSKLVPNSHQRSVHVPSVPLRQYYHSKNIVPMNPGEWDSDSDDEVDDRWMHAISEELLNEFNDVSDGEKVFMKLWNRFIKNRSIIADNALPGTCADFISKHYTLLHSADLREMLLLHCMNLWDYRLLSSSHLHHLMAYYDSLTVRL